MSGIRPDPRPEYAEFGGFSTHHELRTFVGGIAQMMARTELGGWPDFDWHNHNHDALRDEYARKENDLARKIFCAFLVEARCETRESMAPVRVWYGRSIAKWGSGFDFYPRHAQAARLVALVLKYNARNKNHARHWAKKAQDMPIISWTPPLPEDPPYPRRAGTSFLLVRTITQHGVGASEVRVMENGGAS